MPREFKFENNTPFPLVHVRDDQSRAYWNSDQPGFFPATRVEPGANFQIPLREKETPGVIATIIYEFDFSRASYAQLIPQHTVTLIFNSAEDGDGPDVVKGSLGTTGNDDASQIMTIDSTAGRSAPGSTICITVDIPENKVTAQTFTIERIAIAHPSSSLFPVLNEKGLSPSFRTPDQPLWTVEKGAIPASIDLTSGGVVHLNITVRANALIHLLMKGIHGEGKLGSGTAVIEGLSSQFVKADAADLITYQSTMKLPVPDALASTSPWGLSKDFTWNAEVATTRISCPRPTTIELYAVSPWLHSSLVREGVPLQLLRFALLPMFNLPQFPTDFVSYITTRVHKDTGFIYDTYHGSVSYMNAGRLNLHLWLQDYNILHFGESELAKYNDYKEYPPTVNCYDQAGILAFCIGLGIPDETSSKTLTRAYMDPYGYIRPTHLVGWPDFETNSPFFRAQPKDAFIVPPESSNRRHFGNHMFVLYKEKALDACAGPHCGDETLAQYISNAIDPQHSDKTYDSSGKLVPRPNGNIDDVEYLPVRALHEAADPLARANKIYHYFRIAKTAATDVQHFYIPINELAEYLTTHLPSPAFTGASGLLKKISDTDNDIIPDSDGRRYGGLLTYTFSYVFDGVTYPVEIDWHICLSNENALKVLAQVSSHCSSVSCTNDLDEFDQEIIDGLTFYSTAGSPDGGQLARTIFAYGPHAIVLDSPIGTRGLLLIAKSVLAFMKSQEGNDINHDSFLKQSEDENKSDNFITLQQGETRNWTTKIAGYVKCDWEYEAGNIFLLDHQLHKSDGSSAFTFYGRSRGKDSVKIKFTDKFMQQVETTVTFEVN